jgi:hypothetical protein
MINKIKRLKNIGKFYDYAATAVVGPNSAGRVVGPKSLRPGPNAVRPYKRCSG